MSESSLELPTGYPRIKVVGSFDELVLTPLGGAGGVNALVWPRTLAGDFREVGAQLPQGEGICTVEEEVLRGLTLSTEGQKARQFLLADQEMLRSAELSPVLDCVHGSLREPEPGLIPTDVSSWHADSATVAADTYLCSYTGSCSEGLRNDEAIRRADVPETRAALRTYYGGEDDEGFVEFLNENFYDLHYVPLSGARPFSFGFGNLWRVAIAYPGCPVPPCVHRAPLTLPGDPARLLLLS